MEKSSQSTFDKPYVYFTTDFGDVPADVFGEGFHQEYQQLCEPIPWWWIFERRRRALKRKMMLDIVTDYARMQWEAKHDGTL